MKFLFCRLQPLVFIAWLVIISEATFAQTKAQNDSTFQALSKLPTDTNTIKQLLTLAEYLEGVDTLLCERVYNHTLAVVHKSKSPLFECKTLIYKGIFRKTYNHWEDAKALYKEAFKIADKNKMPRFKGMSLSNLANVFIQDNDFDGALYAYLEAARYFEEVKDYKSISLNLGNAASLMGQQNLHEKSLELARKSLYAAEKSGHERTIGLAYKHVASAYSHKGNDSLLIQYSLKSLQYLQKSASVSNLFDLYQGLTYGYLQQKKYRQASRFADSLLRLVQITPNTFQKAFGLILKSRLERETGNLGNARLLMGDAMKWVASINRWDVGSQYHWEMYKLEEASGNYKAALDEFGNYSNLKDSIQKEFVLKENLALEKKYETEKKQIRIEKLEKETQISDLQLSQKQRLIWTLAAISVLIGLLAIFIYLYLKRKNEIAKAEKEIQTQRIKELETERQMLAMSGIIEGEEKERNRMSQDLHDGLGSLLSGVKLSLTSMKGGAIMSESQTQLFGHSLEQLDGAISEMRRVAHNLMPSVLVENGLVAALADFTENLNESGQIKIHFEHFNLNERLNREQEIVSYRMIQEAVNNAIKHADPKQIIIQLRRVENQIQFEVEDDGKGFDPSKISKAKTGGLQNLQHRAEYLKGTLEIQSETGKGTTVVVDFPVV